MCSGLISISKSLKTGQNLYIWGVTVTWAFGQLLTPNRRKGASHHYSSSWQKPEELSEPSEHQLTLDCTCLR